MLCISLVSHFKSLLKMERFLLCKRLTAYSACVKLILSLWTISILFVFLYLIMILNRKLILSKSQFNPKLPIYNGRQESHAAWHSAYCVSKRDKYIKTQETEITEHTQVIKDTGWEINTISSYITFTNFLFSISLRWRGTHIYPLQ